MAIQIVMDRTGDSRHSFNPNDAQELAKAEQRFYKLTNVGSSLPRSGPRRVRSRRFDRSILTQKKLCSFQGWSADNRTRHVALYAVSGR